MEHIAVRSDASRFFFSAMPALGITLGLFMGMQAVIKIDEVVLPENVFRPTLTNIIYKAPPTETSHPVRGLIKPIETSSPPKPKQIEKLSQGDFVFSVPEFEAPPQSIPVGIINEMSQGSGYSPDREEAIAVRQPIPDYPAIALQKGLEGDCEVGFSIDAAGRPFNVEASCTDDVFERSSERAVRKALFAAKVKDGKAVGSDNLVYPIAYRMNEN